MVYKAGIIGTGGIAGQGGVLGTNDNDSSSKTSEASHSGAYSNTPNIELVAAADTDETQLREFGESWNIPQTHLYTTHEDMLTNEKLDVISICTPTFLHCQHTVDAAQSAADPELIWCEKPIATSVSEGEEMIRICKEENTELLINHVFRFTEPIPVLRHQIQQEQLIGDIVSVNARFKRELLRNGTHVIDTLQYLLEAESLRVSGFLNDKDGMSENNTSRFDTYDDVGGGGYIIYKNDVLTTIDCTLPRSLTSHAIYDIYGTTGRLYVDIAAISGSSEIKYWNTDDGEYIEEPISDRFNCPTDRPEVFTRISQHIIDILEKSDNNRSSGAAAIQSLEILSGMFISEYTSSEVSLPLNEPLKSTKINSW